MTILLIIILIEFGMLHVTSNVDRICYPALPIVSNQATLGYNNLIILFVQLYGGIAQW